MKQAALITCHNIKNYGSVFQTYATTLIFNEFGYDIFVIDYQRPGTDKVGFRKKILKESRLANKLILKYIFPLILNPSFNRMERTFESFLEAHVKITNERYLSEYELTRNCPNADLYISGSDQIWNSDINGRIERPYYLSFVPQNKTKISFASSFGKTSLGDEEIQENKKLLAQYKWISTREKSGTVLVNDLGLNADTILDPTLWLTKAQWEKLEEPIKVPQKYILVYQLHKNSQMDKYVAVLQKKYGMPCLRVDLYYHYIVKKGKHVICPTPGQLITLIKNANYVVSDSFHMTAFSVIFNKKFISIYSQNSFNDRIENVLQMFNLERRHLEYYDDYDKLNENIDYSAVNRLLDEKSREMRVLLDDRIRFLL